MITIGIPVGHFMLPWQFANSLVQAVLYLKNEDKKIKVIMSEGSYIEDNKTLLLNLALKDEFEYLIMLDWDHTFEKEDISKLYLTAKNNNLDLCSGLYFIDKGGYKRPALIVGGIVYEDYPQDSLFEVATFGAGFSIISYKAVKAIAEAGGYKRINGWGEDVSFCHRAKQLEFKVWCDSRIKVGHLRFIEI